MFEALTKQIDKIEKLDEFVVRAKFDPFELLSIEAGISRAIMDLENWACCDSNDGLLRAALGQYAEGIRVQVHEHARELRKERKDMRQLPNGDLGVQLRSLATKIEELSHVEFDEAQDRAVRIGRLLRTKPLSTFVSQLTRDLDIEDFLKRTDQSGGSMLGSSSYQWPESDDDKLGMSLLLALHFSDTPSDILEHGCDIFGETNFNQGVRRIYTNVYIPMERDLRDYISRETGNRSPFELPSTDQQSDRVFLVHGHDDGMKHGTARFLENIGLTPVILHEQVNRGATIIEKLEANSDVGFAIILMSADDEGRVKGGDTWEGRPRQNVTLEAGWFMGRFGRNRTTILKKDSMDIPSDLQGLVYLSYDPNGAWKLDLIEELRAVGYNVSMPQK